MLSATFIGHQGWMLSSAQTNLLLDPLLDASFGAVIEAGLRVYPPRRIDHAAFPPIDAVIISHEHDDHLQLRSLNHLDRRIPIYLSERSSTAAFTALGRMGFSVRPLPADEATEIGDLEVRTFSPKFVHDELMEEWDVCTMLVRDRGGEGSFYTSIDVPSPEHAERWMRDQGIRPVVRTRTNNLSCTRVLTSWRKPMAGALLVFGELLRRCKEEHELGRKVPLLLGCGGGWSFSGALEGLNSTAFPADNAKIAEGIKASGQFELAPFLALSPGDTVRMEGGRVTSVDNQPWTFLRAAPRAEWPDRTYDLTEKRLQKVTPLLPSRPLSPTDQADLRAGLRELGRELVGTNVFLGLHSLTSTELAGRRRAFALALQENEQGLATLYEYQPTGADFVRVTDRKLTDYAAGMVCWAHDLLAVMRSEVTVSMFAMGHLFEFVGCAPRDPEPLSLSQVMWKLYHPLRHPDRVLSFYLRELERLPASVPRVPAR